MKHAKTTKVLSFLLCLVMLLGLVPFGAIQALAMDYDGTVDDYYNVISKRDWELAPGIQESEIVLNNDDGSRRQVVHLMEADLNNPYAKVIASYAEMDYTKFQTSTMDQQAAAAEAMGYNVVGAMNTTLSWYNTDYYKQNPDQSGRPLGFTMVDGEIKWTNCEGFPDVLVIHADEKDGVARPADIDKVAIRRIETEADLNGWEEQIIPGGWYCIVENGVNKYSPDYADTNSAPRSLIGIKPDGKVVIMMNDGRQAPYSAGMTMYECAQVFISAGCTYAFNCDGGGSSQFLSQRPGEELEVHCSPSDGALRPTTQGILFVTTAPATGEFARADITTDNQYFTPGSTVTFSALGSDLVGTPADIPADVVWQIKEEGMGTIADGVFVSNGTVGTVTAQMVYNGEVVGEHSVEIVIPEAFGFMQNTMTVPFGKEVNVNLIATINGGLNEVVLKESDVTITLDNTALGTINGFMFASVDEANAPADLTGTITATLDCANLTATASLSLGKGSEVLFDFEDSVDGWNAADVNYPGEVDVKVSHADADSGQVHDGNGSMRFEINTLTSPNVPMGGYAQESLYLDEGIVIENAKSIGTWVYIPDEVYNVCLYLFYFVDGNGDGTYETKYNVELLKTQTVYDQYDEDGWYYYSADISKYERILITGLDQPPINSAKNEANNYRFIEVRFPHTNTNTLWKETGSLNGPHTLYFDNITVDYSEAVDDREAPIFADVTLTTSTETTFVMNKRSPVVTTENVLNIMTNVTENTNKTNATGLNAASAKAYVDGVEVDAKYANGRLSISGVAVADGMHRVKFEICDNAGNKSVVIRLVDVQSGVDASTVQVVPADPSLDKLYGGSVYWMNIDATDIETIQSIQTVIDINGVNHWELDHMTLAAGFTADYAVDEETNTATITITRTGKNTQTGAATIASLPIRIISFDTDIQMEGYTAETFWTTFEFWPQDLKVDVDMGLITYVNGYTSDVRNTFSNEEFSVDTEMYSSSDKIDSAFKEERGTCHVHTPAALPDKDSTCTEAGYTGRTYCEICDSVVDWGTTVPATDHAYEVVDAQFVCSCGDVLELGTGLVQMNGKNYYAVNGKLNGGWISVDDEWYYFDETTFAGLDGEQYADQGVKFVFDNGRVTDGTWTQDANGKRYWYGPGYYRDHSNDSTSSKPYEIDGKTYLFNRQGYMQTGLVHSAGANISGNQVIIHYYFCDETGVGTLYTGFIEDRFCLEGELQKCYQLIEFEGHYYFINDGHKIAKNQGIYLAAKFLEGTDLEEGYYRFDAEGKMEIRNGPQEDGTFYRNGLQLKCYQLVEYEGYYYFINDGHKIAKNKGIYLAAKFLEGTDLKEGYYYFDEEGKMAVRNGPQADGTFYLNDVQQKCYQLVEYEGYYYFINDGHKIAKNQGIYLAAKFLVGTNLEEGYYRFDADGKMILG